MDSVVSVAGWSQEPISTTASHGDDPSHLQTRPWAPSCRTGEEGDRNNPWEVMPPALPWGRARPPGTIGGRRRPARR